jgi:hypothetical protein
VISEPLFETNSTVQPPFIREIMMVLPMMDFDTRSFHELDDVQVQVSSIKSFDGEMEKWRTPNQPRSCSQP